MTKEIVDKQRKYFLSGKTLDVSFRLDALKKLRASILLNKDKIYKAFLEDLNKAPIYVDLTEIGMVLKEIDYFLRHLKRISKPQKVKMSLMNLGAKGYKYYEPHGNVLIVAPWNYPLQLSLLPLVGAIAGGNTAIIKPSNYTPNVAKVIKKILNVFEDKYISVVLGGREQNADLFEQKFDLIFFTGGVSVGKMLLSKASNNVTPCILELGGKSPCIVDEDCDIDLAVKRCVWGKFLNAGQTCVAPDYFFVHKSIKKLFIDKCINQIKKFYYENNKLKKDFTAIVNQKHIERLKNLLEGQEIAFGGNINDRVLEPTILDNITIDNKVMDEEIFGPIMPILEFEDITFVVDYLKRQEHPLSLYYFGKNKEIIDYVLKNVSFGGGCINDTIMHLTEENLPFGGVGLSGMGSYHGKKSFETFSHTKSILVRKKSELKLKYPPYSDKKRKIIGMYFGIK